MVEEAAAVQSTQWLQRRNLCSICIIHIPKTFPILISSCACTRLFVSLLFILVNINVMTCDNRVELIILFPFLFLLLLSNNLY